MLYDKIKALCDSMNISIAELERRAGFGNGTIGKWQSTKVKPNLESLIKIATVLDTTVSELLKETA
jgi:transcriptional regulator with XRE-family HTH domain